MHTTTYLPTTPPRWKPEPRMVSKVPPGKIATGRDHYKHQFFPKIWSKKSIFLHRVLTDYLYRWTAPMPKVNVSTQCSWNNRWYRRDRLVAGDGERNNVMEKKDDDFVVYLLSCLRLFHGLSVQWSWSRLCLCPCRMRVTMSLTTLPTQRRREPVSPLFRASFE